MMSIGLEMFNRIGGKVGRFSTCEIIFNSNRTSIIQYINVQIFPITAEPQMV